MLKQLAFAASALVVTSTTASAAFYNIGLDGYCDEYKFSVVNDLAVGVSYANPGGGVGCDDAYMVGTRLHLRKSVAPGGDVVSLATDFGPFGSGYVSQFIVYLSLKSHTYAIFATADGHSEVMSSGTFSNLGYRDNKNGRTGLPPVTTTFRKSRD
jgi:hypothetical protein